MGRLVYSTETGRMCPECGEVTHKGACKVSSAIPEGDGIVRVRRETKGRKGKGVCVVEGLLVDAAELTKIAKQLKQKCCCGGSAKNGVIEIQGDQREVIKNTLESLGFTVKLAGG